MQNALPTIGLQRLTQIMDIPGRFSVDLRELVPLSDLSVLSASVVNWNRVSHERCKTWCTTPSHVLRTHTVCLFLSVLISSPPSFISRLRESRLAPNGEFCACASC